MKPKKPRKRLRRKISPRYTLPGSEPIEYKNVNLLQKYLNDRGKIVSRRVSGITAKQQRQMTTAIKRARFLALLITGGIKK